jgi:hypothetical protein
MVARDTKVGYVDVEHYSSDSSGEDDEAQEAPLQSRHRRTAGLVSVSAVLLGALMIYGASKVRAAPTQHTVTDEAVAPVAKGPRLYAASPNPSKPVATTPKQDASMTIAEFVTTRRLSEVAADALDQKCPIFKPHCDREQNFVALMHKQLGHLEKHDAGLAQQLHNTTMSPDQQDLLVNLLRLIHNQTVLRIGATVAQTVKHWAAHGHEVVHEKVKEALVRYSKEHGAAGVPPVNASSRHKEDSSMWTVLMHPKMLSMIGDEPTAPSAPVQQQPAVRRLDPIVIMQWIWGVDVLLRLVLLIFQILNKTKTVIMPTWMKTTIMWLNVVGGGITCVLTILILCPIVFLQYWFNAWLLYGNDISELQEQNIPFWKLLEKLPGLKPTGVPSRLLLADPRFAA